MTSYGDGEYTDRLIAMKYTIKQATADHAPLLATIEIAAAGIFPPGSIPDHIRSDSTPIETLLEAVQNGLLWVALAGDGKPVGYALMQLTEDAALQTYRNTLRRTEKSHSPCNSFLQLLQGE